MIKALLSGMGKHKDAAIMFVIGIAAFTWGIKQLSEFLSPVAFTQAIDQKILQAENRSKDFADQKYTNMEKHLDSRHSEWMRAIKRVENSVEGLRFEIREVYRDKRVSTLPVTENTNKN
jgi:hypothetical protein